MSGETDCTLSSYMLVGFDLLAETTFFDKQCNGLPTDIKIYSKTLQVTIFASVVISFNFNEIPPSFCANAVW